ncbi:MAG TPA: hypothetical protein VFI70_00695 [Nitrososphaeraceae archaeon]|nr:hypothetical protein [Nitrososphaeraceae archaeon]
MNRFVARLILLILFGMIVSIAYVNSVYAQIPMPSVPLVSNTASAKNTTTAATAISSFVAHGVRITSPAKGQQVPIGSLTIVGTSKDNDTTNCHVYVIVNGLKPYQNATTTGPGGASDYSKWNFTLTSKYTLIKEGVNKIVAKFSCKPNPAIASFYGVNVTGIRR